MKKDRLLTYGLGAAAVLLVALVLVWALRGPAGDITEYDTVDRTPKISPEYAGVTVPPNICPLNFVVREEGTKYCVRISSTDGEPIELWSRRPEIVIPVRSWRKLLEANGGEPLTFDVYVKDAAGRWSRFRPLTNTIANEKIDPCLVYREMPTYNKVWKNMGIYERDLESYDVTPILLNRNHDRGCSNCHRFLKNDPATMLMNVRGVRESKVKGGLFIVRDGKIGGVVNTKTAFNPIPAIYLAWHPGGEAVAFSTNRVNQTFHMVGDNRHAVDSFSDVGVYLIASNTVTTCPNIARADRLETTPAWSPDGEWLYFCSARPTVTAKEREAEERRDEELKRRGKAPKRQERHHPFFRIDRYRELHYDLVRIRYDIEAKTFRGKVETVLTTDLGQKGLARPEIPPEKTGTLWSVAQPRFSPDGRFVLVCLCAYGNFPVYQKTSDLYMLDLETKTCHPLTELNSDDAESWHTWSSNGRWIVFSSKRPDGLMARPWISYVDEHGRARRPFILPQKDPGFYESYIRVFNRPELTVGPIPLSQRRILKTLYDPDRQLKAELDPRLRKPDGVSGATERR